SGLLPSNERMTVSGRAFWLFVLQRPPGSEPDPGVRHRKHLWLTIRESALGFFHTGFVLTCQPNWERLNEFPAQYGFRGYKHKNREVWLLDFWPRPGRWRHLRKHRDRCFADLDCAGDRFTTDTSGLPSETQAALARLAQVVNVLRRYDKTYGPGWVRLALAVSPRVGCPAFFFIEA